MGPSIFNMGTKKSQEISKNELMEIMANDPNVIEATNSMITSVEARCPPSQNSYPKDPPLGDVKFVVQNWKRQPATVQQAVRDFLNVIMVSDQFKGLKVSGSAIKHSWKLRFGIIDSGPKTTQPMPGWAGQSYVGQYVPAQSYIRHETQKQGNAKIVSNLSQEVGQGDLINPAHPDAYCDNEAVPPITSIQEAMTDISSAACYPHQLQAQTQEAPRIGEADTKVMKDHPTELASHQENKKMTKSLKRKGVGIPAYSKSETKKSIFDSKTPDTKTTSISGSGNSRSLSEQVFKQAKLASRDEKKEEPIPTFKGEVTAGDTKSYDADADYEEGSGVTPVADKFKDSMRRDSLDADAFRKIGSFAESDTEDATPVKDELKGPVRKLHGYYGKKGKKLNVLGDKNSDKISDSTVKNSSPEDVERIAEQMAEYLVDNTPKTAEEALSIFGVASQYATNAWHTLPSLLRNVITKYFRQQATRAALHVAGTVAGSVGGAPGVIAGNIAAEIATDAIQSVFDYFDGSAQDKVVGQTSIVSNQQIQSGGNSQMGGGPSVSTTKNEATPSSTPATTQKDAFSTTPVKIDSPAEATKSDNQNQAAGTKEAEQSINKVNVSDAVTQNSKDTVGELTSTTTVTSKQTTSAQYTRWTDDPSLNGWEESLDFGGLSAVRGARYGREPPLGAQVKDKNGRVHPYYPKSKKTNGEDNGVEEPFNPTGRKLLGKLQTDDVYVDNADKVFYGDNGIEHRRKDVELFGPVKYRWHKELKTYIPEKDYKSIDKKYVALTLGTPAQRLLFRRQLFKDMENDFIVASKKFDERDKYTDNPYLLFGNAQNRTSERSHARDRNPIQEPFPGQPSQALGPHAFLIKKTEEKKAEEKKKQETSPDIMIPRVQLPSPDDPTAPEEMVAPVARASLAGNISGRTRHSSFDDFEKKYKTLPRSSTYGSLKGYGFGAGDRKEEEKKIIKRGNFHGRAQKEDNILEADTPLDKKTITSQNQGASIKSVDEKGNPTDRSSSASADIKNDPRSNLIPVEANENMLRPSFPEGGANKVMELNEDPHLKLIDRLEWQAFNNYTWEANEEDDNILKGMNMVDDFRRFKGMNDQEELLDTQAKDAIQEEYNAKMTAFSIPSEMVNDVEEEMWNIIPPPYSVEGPTSVDSVFHDVYLPDWHSMPESSPWKKMTQVNGTQLPDAQILNSNRVMGNDWSSGRWENDFLAWTTV